MTDSTNVTTSPASDGSVGSDREPTDSSTVRSSLPALRSIAAWAALTGLATALDGWTGLIVGVGIAAALLAGARPRSMAAAGVVCAALVPVWVLSSGSVTAEDVTPALVTESLIPHHLAFAALMLLVAAVVLEAAPTSTPEGDVVPPVPDAGPLGATGRALRWAAVGAATVAALVACMVAWQT